MDDPPLIDSHAHVWDRTCTYIPGARYHPGYEAPVYSYLRLLDAHGIARAVLVQPSFLGTDNTYLLSCLRAHPDRLRGIVVLNPSTSDTALDKMTALGVIGARFNLVGHDPTTIADPTNVDLIRRITARNWWAEVQVDGAHWPMVLDVMQTCGARVMVDHFGKPAGPNCPGHAALLQADPARHSVKFSAPYRQIPKDLAPYAQAFLKTWGPERCLWGSDWPWTQHEQRHTYADTKGWLANWVPTKAQAAMRQAAVGLLGFPE